METQDKHTVERDLAFITDHKFNTLWMEKGICSTRLESGYFCYELVRSYNVIFGSKKKTSEEAEKREF